MYTGHPKYILYHSVTANTKGTRNLCPLIIYHVILCKETKFNRSIDQVFFVPHNL